MTGNPTPARADPFASLDDLTDFKPESSPKPKPAPELVRQVSEASNFPSRAPATKPQAVPEARPPQRRHRTGRNMQLNMKVTAAVAERFTRLSEARGWVFGETLSRALDALEAELNAKDSR